MVTTIARQPTIICPCKLMKCRMSIKADTSHAWAVTSNSSMSLLDSLTTPTSASIRLLLLSNQGPFKKEATSCRGKWWDRCQFFSATRVRKTVRSRSICDTRTCWRSESKTTVFTSMNLRVKGRKFKLRSHLIICSNLTCQQLDMHSNRDCSINSSAILKFIRRSTMPETRTTSRISAAAATRRAPVCLGDNTPCKTNTRCTRWDMSKIINWGWLSNQIIGPPIWRIVFKRLPSIHNMRKMNKCMKVGSSHGTIFKWNRRSELVIVLALTCFQSTSVKRIRLKIKHLKEKCVTRAVMR